MRRVSIPVNRPGSNDDTGSRVLEYAVVATVALLAADALRPELGLLWRTLGLLIGT
jgi:hypothetical protein